MGKISRTESKTNEKVCNILKVQPTLVQTIQSRKPQYYGHIKRHTTICKDILEGKLEGKRKAMKIMAG